ncbi:hypothetical protein ACJMK2_005123 [Sinanodonta woodiana]|uniref:Uncharacterized protein n=1 Tax=Sinanodonta woodiana TaxID=1069815 RepID=A0ABD3VSJ1_SINWO
MGNKTVKMVGNSAYNQAVQGECRTITDLTEDYINAFTNDTVEIREILENERRNIDEYTALVYRKFVMLASYVSIVGELGMTRSDIHTAYSKFGHALCKLKKFRTDLGLGRPLSDMCQYSGYVSLHSRARKIGYSIFVLKQGADSLTNILLQIREVVLRETNGCQIRCIPELPKTLECRND